jgi:hypothetical protein
VGDYVLDPVETSGEEETAVSPAAAGDAVGLSGAPQAAPRIGTGSGPSAAVPRAVGVPLFYAGSMADPTADGSIMQVTAYPDNDGDSELPSAVDAFLRYDTFSGGVWTLTLSTADLTPGTGTALAQASDNFSILSDPLTVTFRVL